MILTAEDWGGEYPTTWTPKSKGKAIDLALRREMKSTSPLSESYDLEWVIPDTDIRYHEFKSTSTGSISISRMELDFAQRKYFKERSNTLYWVIDQGAERDSFTIEYFVLFSDLYYQDMFIESHQKSGGVYFWLDRCRRLEFPLA